MYVQPQDAAANWNGKAQVVPLAERPTLTVRGLLVPSGGHLSDDLPVCPVLADSKCLFYCAVASHDAEKWVKTHGPRDEPKHVEQARRELQDAKATLELVADRAVSAGEPDVATRLRGQGTGSYTGLDEMKYMAKVMGRIIIVQTGEVQVMYGDVDVGGLHYNGGRCWTQSSTLGAFEELGASERFLISDLPSGVSQAYEANPDVLAWLEIPGAASGNDDFVNLFADLHTAMAEDDTLIRDPPRDQQTTLGRTDMIEREIASVRPDWLGPMQHLILGLLSTYRCRLSDVFLHEQVMLLHVILEANGSPFFWHHTNGCWLRFEGLLPEPVFVSVKEHLLTLEGLYRSLPTKFAGVDDKLLRGVDVAYEKHGNNWDLAKEGG